jgi:transcriptional regulator with XRE-family HTH domain
MSTRAPDTYARAAAIVARIPQGVKGEEMAVEVQSRIPAFKHLSEESRAEVVRGIQRTLSRWRGIGPAAVMPPDSSFDRLRKWTRARAAEGLRLEDLLRLIGLVHQLSWQLLCDHARSDESDVLRDLAGPVAEYADRISAAVTEAYLAERELLVSEEERRTRGLLDRLSVDSPLRTADRELADRLGIPLLSAYSPFVIAMPRGPSDRHAALAAHLRRAGWTLAVTQSDRVVGLAWKPPDLPDLGVGPAVLLAIGEPTPRGELAAAREELDALVEHGRRMGLHGRLKAEDYLLETLLGGSPRLAARLKDRVLVPLSENDHGELAQTLQTFLRCRFDRTATSAALHVHRNTLANRLRRIEEITGLDLRNPRDLACVYMAIG